jgi:hypothetical protein
VTLRDPRVDEKAWRPMASDQPTPDQDPVSRTVVDEGSHRRSIDGSERERYRLRSDTPHALLSKNSSRGSQHWQHSARELGDPFSVTLALVYSALLHQFMGDPGQSSSLAEQAAARFKLSAVLARH